MTRISINANLNDHFFLIYLGGAELVIFLPLLNSSGKIYAYQNFAFNKY